jgi:hypothetical protein
MGSDTALNKIREQDRRGPVRRPCGGAALLQRLHGVVFSGIRIAAAGQPHEFLKMHLMAVAIAGVLLRHRRAAAIGVRIHRVVTFG